MMHSTEFVPALRRHFPGGAAWCLSFAAWLAGGLALSVSAAEWYVPSVHPDETRAGRECLVVADRRVFAVMAFINAAGFDEEAKNATMTSTRTRVRELVRTNLQAHPDKLAACREAYQRMKCSNADFIEYAVLLSPGYPFKKVGPDGIFYNAEVLRRLGDVAAMVNDFWVAARLDEVWNAVKPDYLAELGKYDVDRMARDLDFVWSYVRMPRREARTMVSVPNLLDRHYSADSIGCGKYFVSVEGPGSHGYGLNIHEYLHEIVNPAVARHRDEFQSLLQPYYDRWLKNPAHRGYETLQMYTQECLVKALEARVSVALRPELLARKRNQVSGDVKNGYELTGLFYEALADFEKGTTGFGDYVAALFRRLPPP